MKKAKGKTPHTHTHTQHQRPCSESLSSRGLLPELPGGPVPWVPGPDAGEQRHRPGGRQGLLRLPRTGRSEVRERGGGLLGAACRLCVKLTGVFGLSMGVVG